MNRTVFTPAQTQSLVSTLCTVGAYVSIDVRGYDTGAVCVTLWRDSEPTIYRIAQDGEVREITGVFA